MDDIKDNVGRSFHRSCRRWKSDYPLMGGAESCEGKGRRVRPELIYEGSE